MSNVDSVDPEPVEHPSMESRGSPERSTFRSLDVVPNESDGAQCLPAFCPIPHALSRITATI